MAPEQKGSRIVREWPAEQTGESYKVTEDGTLWKTNFYPEDVTGVVHGVRRGNIIERTR